MCPLSFLFRYNPNNIWMKKYLSARGSTRLERNGRPLYCLRRIYITNITSPLLFLHPKHMANHDIFCTDHTRNAVLAPLLQNSKIDLGHGLKRPTSTHNTVPNEMTWNDSGFHETLSMTFTWSRRTELIYIHSFILVYSSLSPLKNSTCRDNS